MINFMVNNADGVDQMSDQAIATSKMRMFRMLTDSLCGEEVDSPYVLIIADQLAYRGLEKSAWYYNSIPIMALGALVASRPCLGFRTVQLLQNMVLRKWCVILGGVLQHSGDQLAG